MQLVYKQYNYIHNYIAIIRVYKHNYKYKFQVISIFLAMRTMKT